MKTVVFTSDRRNWLLKGFFYQWEKYDGRPIDVMGFTDPGPVIRGDHAFVSMGRFADYPVEKWSNAVIKYLQTIDDPLVEIWLEDYWLIRDTNRAAVRWAESYLYNHPDVIRFDLATDRMYAQNAVDIGPLAFLDLVEAKGQYSFSWQVNIWNRFHLLEMMVPYETPWESELNGTQRLNEMPYRVVGSRQSPVKYHIAMNKGEFDRTGKWMFPQRTLVSKDWEVLDTLGFTHP